MPLLSAEKGQSKTLIYYIIIYYWCKRMQMMTTHTVGPPVCTTCTQSKQAVLKSYAMKSNVWLLHS